MIEQQQQQQQQQQGSIYPYYRRHPRAAAAGLAFGLMVLVVASAMGAKPAQAAFPGKDGSIAYFAKDSSGYEQIYEVTASGTFQLTTDKTTHRSPEYSPDGKTIIYVAPDSSGHFQIYAISSAPPPAGSASSSSGSTSSGGGGVRPPSSSTGGALVPQQAKGSIVPQQAEGLQPATTTTAGSSSDGDKGGSTRQREATTLKAPAGAPQALGQSASSSAPVQLTFEPTDHLNADFSPDGQAIAYNAFDSSTGFFQIYLLTGSGTFQLTTDKTGHFNPDWGPG